MTYINPIFKFSTKEHRDALCEKGKIRIGTLSDFKDSERHKGKILDLGEGNKTINIHFDEISLPTNELNKYGIFLFSGDGIMNLRIIYQTLVLLARRKLILTLMMGTKQCQK
jgi:hypothetical protein